MIRKFLLSLFCMLIVAVTVSLPNLVGQEPHTTTWKGTLDTNAKQLRLEINITENAGKLTGEGRSLDQNNASLKLADIEIDGDTLSFSIPQAGAEFDGTYTNNGTVADGTFRQGGGNIALTLTKSDATSSAPGINQSANRDSLQDLGKVVEHYIDQDYALGAELLVIQNGQKLYHESFGVSDREDKRQWENDTLCNIRSMTKPITSAAAQILIDRKLLDLDDPVANYLESFDNEKSGSITVRQVLSHRSGLPLTNLMTPYQYSSLAEQVAAAGTKGPQFEPGSKFWYSDIGTDVVGALVEKVSGEPLHEFVQREIFDPLEMNNTLYGIDASDKRLASAASAYMKVPKGWMRFWKPDVRPLYPFAWGSQTVYSTTTDYAKFLKMLMNQGKAGDRQLLSTNAVGRMLEPVSRLTMMGSDTNFPTEFRNLEAHYGQMVVTHHVIGKEKEQPVIIGHSGSDGTNAWAFPERDLMILYFTQSRGGMTPLRIEGPIDRLIVHRGEAEQAPQRLQPYLGTYIANYDNFHGEEFTVKVRNGKLVLDVPSQMAFELLEPDEKGYWAFAIDPKKVQATFDRNENDEVTGLKLHKAGQVYEVPAKGTARAQELSRNKIAAQEGKSEEELQAAWIGQLDMGVMKPVMQFRVVVKESGETAAWFDSVTEGRTGFEATWSVEGDQLQFDVAKIRLKYRGTLNEAGDKAEGIWSQGGRELPLTLKKQATEYDSVNVWENRPQRPVGPFPYDAEEVTFQNNIDDVTLAGTLTIPKRPGKHPAVILISGSGAQDRDETLMEHKPFLVLADYLTRRGIAVLRYDDRGTAKSTGNFGKATTEDFARDASAAVEFLKSHERINPLKIGLAGHSEGGLIAPMVVGSRDDVAFVVLMAATGVDGVTISLSQGEAMLRANGTDENAIKIELAVSRAAMDVVINAAPGSDSSADLDQAIESVIQTLPESEREAGGKKIREAIAMQKGRLQADWMRFFLSYDPRPALANIKCPVLAIIGSKDLQVLPDLNMPEIRKALNEGGNQDFEMIELEGLNHLFQECETGSMNEYVTIPETFNPVALKSIGDWIIKHTTPIK